MDGFFFLPKEISSVKYLIKLSENFCKFNKTALNYYSRKMATDVTNLDRLIDQLITDCKLLTEAEIKFVCEKVLSFQRNPLKLIISL